MNESPKKTFVAIRKPARKPRQTMTDYLEAFDRKEQRKAEKDERSRQAR